MTCSWFIVVVPTLIPNTSLPNNKPPLWIVYDWVEHFLLTFRNVVNPTIDHPSIEFITGMVPKIFKAPRNACLRYNQKQYLRDKELHIFPTVLSRILYLALIGWFTTLLPLCFFFHFPHGSLKFDSDPWCHWRHDQFEASSWRAARYQRLRMSAKCWRGCWLLGVKGRLLGMEKWHSSRQL